MRNCSSGFEACQEYVTLKYSIKDNTMHFLFFRRPIPHPTTTLLYTPHPFPHNPAPVHCCGPGVSGLGLSGGRAGFVISRRTSAYMCRTNPNNFMCSGLCVLPPPPSAVPGLIHPYVVPLAIRS